MTVEDKKVGLMGGEEAEKDVFPVGMRVLAVDDNPTCLRVLERCLRSCKYQVTTTNQAIKALEMLRENRDKFDLVISDVNMPDMDGFKLLELVGLEMDLPVIMLSSHSDHKLVMKGITHGACDYLLKPVRNEEIQNIWQHVVRRKFSSKDRNKSTDTDRAYGHEGGNGAAAVANGDSTAKLNKKRKDQIDEEDDDGEDTGHDNEDPSAQKKPRVVWSVELHRKFVTAVNQLGLEKAVPKKILDLMNVEGLTRENVASHLQIYIQDTTKKDELSSLENKYRLYLKRLSNVASQQANIVAALGSKDPSYIRMSPLDRFGDFRTLAESRRLSSMSLSSYPPSGMLGRLNTPANLSTRGITTSGLIHQPNLPENMGGSVSTTMGKFQQGTMPASQNANFFPVMPSMEFNQMQQSKPATHVGEFSGIDDPTKCGVATGITDEWRTDSRSSNISVYNQTGSHAFLQGSQQKTQSRGNHEIQSSVGGGSTTFSSLHVDRGCSSYKDPHDGWRGGEQLHGLPSVNPLPLGGHAQLPLSNGGNNSFHIHDNRVDFSTNLAASGNLENSRGDAQCQAGLLGNVVSSLSYAQIDRLGEHNQNLSEISSQSLACINSLAGVSASVPICSGGPSEDPSTTLCNRSSDFSHYVQQLIGQSTLQHTQVGSSSINSNTRCNENYFTDQAKDGIYQGNYSLDELMDAVIKQEHTESMLMDGNMGFDPHPLRSCV